MHDAADAQPGKPIRFLLNGEPVLLEAIDPTMSVLQYVRENHRLTGTKEGCAEGDCGACTVVIGSLDGDKLMLKTINACICFVATLDGKALFTVEYLRHQANGRLHPVQQAMVERHASQCGFCTPGFVMSLWNLYLTHQAAGCRPDDRQIRSALSGNLCRCTGYRPIIEAASAMFELPAVSADFNDLAERLKALQRRDTLALNNPDCRYFAPKSLVQLTALRREYPEATILAGGTDVGLWVNKQFRRLDPLIYLGEVPELREIVCRDGVLRIGAAVSLSEAYRNISAHYPEMDDMWERFASQPIRNAGTLGGNVANGSPIGDSMPALIALGAEVVLCSSDGQRRLPLEDLYIGYMKKSMREDEIVETIVLPLPSPGLAFRCYKLSKRHDSDISSVFGAFAITLNGDKVAKIRIAFGGMAATPKRAVHAEQTMLGKAWDETTVRQAMQALDKDYQPLSDMRASAGNRRQSAQNLLYRFFLETRPVDPLPADGVNVFAMLSGADDV
ncbi:MAG: xanthine dehydrogenase small subunit [Gammaproteobacteria bacterium]|nr:xanthine dehydrogenase small subunit [Gammaproteobacteria bacterium]